MARFSDRLKPHDLVYALVVLVLFGGTFFCIAPVAMAQGLLSPTSETAEANPEAAPPEPAITVASLEKARNEVAAQLEAAQAAATEETAVQLGITFEALQGRVDRLRALDGMLQQQLGTLQRMEELASSRADLEREIATYQERGLEEPPPYTLAFSEGMGDAVVAEQRHLETLETELASSESERASNKARLVDAQRSRRAANEAATQSDNPAVAQSLTWKLNRAKLEERFAQVAVDTGRLRHELTEAELALSRARLAHLETRVGAVLVHTRFEQEELDARLAEVASRRAAVEAEIPKLRDALRARDAERNVSRDALQQAQGEEAVASLTAEMQMRTLRAETAARRVELAEELLILLDREKQLWEWRFAVWQGAADDVLADWKEQTQQFLDEARRDREVQEGRLLDVRGTALEQERLLAEWAGNVSGRETIAAKVEALRRREEALNEYLSALLPVERFAGRLLVEIDRERALVTWGERWDRYRRVATTIWNYEVVAYEDGAVTVRKLVIAFLVLTIGFLFSGRVCRAIRNVLVARTRINENAAAAVEKLLYYLAFVLILLYTLNLVNIPLTLFAFFGGAIAIAVGFGAQHLINNFISGFILMLERPIRIGDLVEVDGVHGIIEHVGARSTRLLTSQNIHLLIPNSSLLENTVVNWSLSGEKFFTKVGVGVAYGSPTDQVAALIREAATATKAVLDTPKPIVFFTDFGDNALGFEVHFWIRMRRITDKRLAESELRFNIDRLFREHDICISYPQRDVHLDTLRPLEVRIVKDETGETD